MTGLTTDNGAAKSSPWSLRICVAIHFFAVLATAILGRADIAAIRFPVDTAVLFDWFAALHGFVLCLPRRITSRCIAIIASARSTRLGIGVYDRLVCCPLHCVLADGTMSDLSSVYSPTLFLAIQICG